MTSSLVEFAIIWTIATVPFGPNALLSVDSAIRNGWPKALAVPIGISVAAVIYATLSVTLLGSMLDIYPDTIVYLTIIGASYLIYVGIRIARRGIIGSQSDGESVSSLKLGINGVLVSLSNPKAALMYLAIMPKYLDKDPSLIDTGVLITIAVSIVFMTYCGYSLAARIISSFFIGKPSRQILFNYFSAMNFCFIGAYFLFSAFEALSK